MDDLIQTITKKPLAAVGIIVAILLLLVGVVVLTRGGGVAGTEDTADITIRKDGKTLLIDDSGRVVLKKDGQEYVDYWNQEKLEIFKLYLSENASEQGLTFTGYSIVIDGVSYSLPGDDELIETIIEETESGGGGGGDDEGSGGGDGGDGGGLDDYFTSPTPVPSSGSGGGGGGPSWCKLWRLSYCADPLPTRTPTPTPTPTEYVVPYVFDCGLGEDLVTDRTVISNTLCLKSPTPTPTPTPGV